jgi:hypothetical protein
MVKLDTVKSLKMSFTSDTSANPCEAAKPSPNFRYRQRPLTGKIAAPAKLDNGGRG